MHDVVVALGSNLGDRMGHLDAGLRELRGLAPELVILRVSRVMETPPWGDPDQGPFLNMVLLGRTPLGPRPLLEELLQVERRRGRNREEEGHRQGGPRTLDLDLILHGASVVQEADLVVPHPRWHERTFVALPLLELLPEGSDPRTGLPLAERVGPEVRLQDYRDLGPLPGWEGLTSAEVSAASPSRSRRR